MQTGNWLILTSNCNKCPMDSTGSTEIFRIFVVPSTDSTFIKETYGKNEKREEGKKSVDKQ